MSVARELSIDYEGLADVAAINFGDISGYCLKKSGLGLPRAACFDLAKKLTLAAQKYSHEIAGAVREGLHFMIVDEDGPRLITSTALKYIVQFIKNGPKSPENFALIYRYAVSEGGLKMTRPNATKLAFAVSCCSSGKNKVSPKNSP